MPRNLSHCARLVCEVTRKVKGSRTNQALRLGERAARHFGHLVGERVNGGCERVDINHAYERKDFQQMEELVHKLYGSCCYCGVPRLKRISGLLDKILQHQQYDQLAAPVTTLNNEIEEVLRWGYQRDIDRLFDLSTG